MKQTKRWLSVMLVLVLVFSLCTSAFAADTEQEPQPEPTLADNGKLRESLPNTNAEVLPAWNDGEHQPGDQVRVVVLMNSAPTGEKQGLIQSQLSKERVLVEEHNGLKRRMEQKAVAYTVNFEYTALLNGMSVTMDYADIGKVAAMPGVREVFIAREYKQPELQPASNSATNMIGADLMDYNLSANGSGKTIAVLDTGITPYHEAFQVYDNMLQSPAYGKVGMLKQIEELGHGAYYSQKIPYQYDYADGDNDAIDDGSSHGSHVAGIAAGYVKTEEGEVTFRGSAPDAQILAMKIFGSTEKTTSSDIYFAALDDAFKLDVDVINMSIGAPNGFTHDSELETETFGDIYARLEEAGIICCISAGNEANMGENAGNWTGGGYVTSDYTDYGVLGSPASYDGNIAVASMENVDYPAYQITVGGEGYAYRDHNGTEFLDTFAGQELEYVMVPDLGVAEAYADIDVSGKVAVISRGEITFQEKVEYAAGAGAIAAVVYDNQQGALVTMAIENVAIPAVFVSQEAGAAFAAQDAGTFTVESEPTIVENPEGWGMSSFSSWGPTNDLKIKPTITGIGGNVNSALAGTQNGYEVASGTSMAAPNISGAYASLLEALMDDDPSLSKAEAAALARNRSLSHAYVAIEYKDDAGNYVPYSPRRQGAGLMDLPAAYTATLAITDPLAELGDDPAKSGVFTITAELENTGDAERTFDVSLDVLADAPIGSPWGTVYNALQSMLLEEGVDYTVEAPESVTLAAGEKKTVTVTITLTDDTKAFLDTYFVNGAFIEGYLYFDYVDYDTNAYEFAHVTYMGYYGDWAAAPALETHDWRDLLEQVPEDQLPNWAEIVEWEINTTPGMGYLVDEENTPKLYAGDAPFGYPEDGAYSRARIAVSNDPDTAYYTAMLVVPTIIRNCEHIVMIARNAETGEIYAVDDTPYCQKTYFDTEEGNWSAYAWFRFDGMDIYSGEEPTPIADDTPVVLEFYANAPYGEDELGKWTPEEIVEKGQKYLSYTVDVTVDSAAPEIAEWTYNAETGELTVTASDNQYLAAIYVTDLEGNDLCEAVPFADDEAGQSHTVTVNIGEQLGDQQAFVIGAMDYATNEGYVVGSVAHEHDWSEWEVVAEPTCEEAGVQGRYCQICFEEEYEEIPALGHDWGEWEVVTEPTCEAEGEQVRVCANCGEEETEAIAALGHDWDDGVVTVAPTLISEGEMLYTCKNDPSHTKTEVLPKLSECDGEDECPSKAFTDVDRSPESWSHEPIDWAVLMNITKGTSTTTFSPDKACTRAQAVTFLWRASGCPAPKTADSPFEDVTLDMWYADAVLWAVEQGITNGTSETTFSPDDTCTRAQIVTFLWRMHGQPEAKSASSFDDVPADAYFVKAVDWAVERGITNGTSETTFEPDVDCTRAHIVTFLYRDWQAEQ